MANHELATAAEVAELRRRLNQLEDQFTGLAQQLRPAANGKDRWWRGQVGAFAGDAVYEEIARLGREWRDAQRPEQEGAE
jgi:hypothetical protein